MKHILEYNKSDLKPLTSFKLKKTLNPDVWTSFGQDGTIKEDIREELLDVANEYINTVDFRFEVLDIILVGSMCNYNWSEYADFDLHILTDYSKINSDIDFVGFYFDLHKKNWGNRFPIQINGYDVELYVQDSNDKNFSSMGIYSLSNDKWVKYPEKINVKINLKDIESKSTKIMKDIDLLENMLDSTKSENKDLIDNISTNIKKIWKKIKKYRKEGLETDESEFSVGNLVFKFLRRNGYIEKCVSIKNKILLMKYDK